MAKTGEISFGYMDNALQTALYVAHALHNNLYISTALKLAENILAFASAIRILSLHVLVVVVLGTYLYLNNTNSCAIIFKCQVHPHCYICNRPYILYIIL